MPTAIREQLLDNIASQVSARYGVDTTIDLAQASKELVTVLSDEGETAADDAYGLTDYEMTIAIARGEPATEPATLESMRAQASQLLAQIIVDVFTDETFGGLAVDASYIAGGISVEAAKVCAAEAQFTVRYSTVRGDPFNQEQ